MTLSLITPVSSNFIKDWVSQNEINCDLIDDYAGPYTIQSYTPILTATTTTPSLGTGGVITGSYYRLFNMIYTWGEFRFKTGFSVGSGAFEISLPFPAKTIATPQLTAGQGPIVGTARLWNNSSGGLRQPAIAQLRSTTKITFNIKFLSGETSRVVGSGTPFHPWAIDDGVNWFVRYMRDA